MNGLSMSIVRVTCNTNTLTALAAATSTASSLSSLSTPSAFRLWPKLCVSKRENSSSSAATAAATVCPHLAYNNESEPLIHQTAEWRRALPYHEIPGPKPIPILGNTSTYSRSFP